MDLWRWAGSAVPPGGGGKSGEEEADGIRRVLFRGINQGRAPGRRKMDTITRAVRSPSNVSLMSQPSIDCLSSPIQRSPLTGMMKCQKKRSSVCWNKYFIFFVFFLREANKIIAYLCTPSVPVSKLDHFGIYRYIECLTEVDP